MPKTTKPRRPVSSARTGSRTSSVAAAELLLEIGVEELPYQFIAPALALLKDSAEQLLKDQRLAFQSAHTLGTPRRLTLVVEGLALQQPSVLKETMGPSKAVAFDHAGQPTRAAAGFAAGQGIAVQDLQIRRTPKGEYLFAVKQEQGLPTNVVLKEFLPQLIAKLSFPKAMKWNSTAARFARPVRWLVALYGGTTLPIEFAGITAGNRTEGHRVLGSAKGIVVRDCESYRRGLERHGVIPDPERRRHMIEEQIAALCKKTGVTLNVDGDLLDQAVYTTECPNAIIGSFKETYLDVPEEILITSMKEHQGFFSLRHKETGKLVPHFIAVTNNRAKDMGLIREGNERVLAARLADAKFFFDEDRKVRLEDRVRKLTSVTFHQKLGTMAQKQERLVKLVAIIASSINLGSESHDLINQCRRAADLCKADLLTGIVGEFPELQGIMGGYYARHDGELENVSKAIRDQYFPRGMEGRLPETLHGKVLALADRLDTIVAFFQAGILPKGSEDPFALRRHALSIVRILVEGKVGLDLQKIVDEAKGLFGKNDNGGGSMLTDSFSFIVERFRFYAGTTQDLRNDVVTALTNFTGYESKECNLVSVLDKMRTLQEITSKPEFDPLIVGFKRAHRLVEKEEWDRKPVDPALFKDPSEAELLRQLEVCRNDFDRQMSKRRYDYALNALVRLKPAIDAFFAGVMVNAEEAELRSNRLSLLKDADRLFMEFADFSQIVVQGG